MGFDKRVFFQNTSAGAIFGGMLGLANTILIITVFTVVSVNRFMNFYIGGFFMVLGVLLLYRVHKRRGMISNDLLGTKETIFGGQEESESLLRSTENPTYKGGVGAELLHIPLCYKDSFILPPAWN